ncbi:cyclic nucleotide-binding protein [Legionella nautarum]|uniref:Cyclic nucleotide-binding protein n=2 Tax=Legionella nautarum TaxID=45070 RepID=A0A0W0WTT1_9GAMM|nr:cyclic nucleotide-binding protein [Legionella nautarum]
MELDSAELIKIVNCLKQTRFFKVLSPQAMWQIANICRVRSFHAGELIMEEGSEAQGIFIITKGKVEIFKTSKAAEMLHLAELKENDLFGEISILDALETTASAKAISDVDCFFISSFDFTTEVQSHPEIAIQLLRLLGANLRDAANGA